MVVNCVGIVVVYVVSGGGLNPGGGCGGAKLWWC